ncbi:MAG: tRNA (adenosine(37)-N6)-dimethylallyltransferase MiaA [Flavobacteriales bacterium]
MTADTDVLARSVRAPILKTERPLLVVIVGPTAVGKTSIAIQLAQRLGCEIVSADSRQVYRNMAIGTAQPSDEELRLVTHHFIACKDPNALYSAGQFEQDANQWLNAWFERHRTAIMCGGSGLYVKAVLEGLDDIPSDLGVRNALNERLEQEGLATLVKELQSLDPKIVDVIDLNNPQRVIRALEVCLASKKPYSSFLANQMASRPFDTWIIGLHRDREKLNDRINQRVESMIQDGLLKEVKSLWHLKDENALQTVGFKEWGRYFDNECTLEEVQSEIQLRTRQFAKRQMTWFKKMNGINWFDAEQVDHIHRELERQCVIRGWTLPEESRISE